MLDTILACVGGALRWYVAALVLSLPSVPLFVAWLPPGIGWAVARCLGPQLVVWAALLPSIVTGSTEFSPSRVLVAALAVTAVSTLLAFFLLKPVHGVKRAKQCSPLHSLLAFEGLLLGIFLFLSVLVSWCVSVGATDAMTDAGFFIGILRQRTFPIEDPGLAGFTLHYYIFGFYAKAAVAFFTGLGPMEAYRVAVAATAAAQIAAIAVYLRAFGWTWLFSSMGALGLGFCSNFEAFLLVLKKFALGGPYNADAATGWLWQDFVTGGFLSAGFLGGALHSTILSFSIQPIFYALCTLVLLAPAVEQSRRDWALVCIGAMMAAWAGASDTWELPMYLGLPVLCFLSTWRMRTPKENAWVILGFLTLFVVASQPLRPLSHQAPLRLGWDAQFTPLTVLLRHWEIFFLPFQIWLVRQVAGPKRNLYIAPALLAVLSILLNNGLCMILALLVVCALELRSKNVRLRTCFTLAFMSFAMLAVVECVYLRNTTPFRFNTIMHVNPIAWNLLSVAGLVLVAVWCEKKTRARWAAVALAVVLLLPYYFVFSVKGRIVDFKTQDTRTGLAQIAKQSPADAELIEWIWAEQKQRRLLNGVLLEASLQEYTEQLPARLSAPTGLRSFLGYSGHAYHEILYNNDPAIVSRQKFAQALRERAWAQSADRCAILKATLERNKVDYVALAHVERQLFHPSFQAAVEACLTPLHAKDFFRVAAE